MKRGQGQSHRSKQPARWRCSQFTFTRITSGPDPATHGSTPGSGNSYFAPLVSLEMEKTPRDEGRRESSWVLQESSWAFCAAGLQWVQLQGYFSPALMCPLPKSSGSFPTACSRCSPRTSPTADGIRKLIQWEKNNNNSLHFLPLLQVFPTSYKTTHKYEGCSPDYAAPTLINTLSLKPTGRIRLAHTMNISSPLNYILIWDEQAPRGLAQSREVSSS